MKIHLTLLAALCGLTVAAFAAMPDDGSVLPFPDDQDDRQRALLGRQIRSF